MNECTNGCRCLRGLCAHTQVLKVQVGSKEVERKGWAKQIGRFWCWCCYIQLLALNSIYLSSPSYPFIPKSYEQSFRKKLSGNATCNIKFSSMDDHQWYQSIYVITTDLTPACLVLSNQTIT